MKKSRYTESQIIGEVNIKTASKVARRLKEK